MIQVNNLSKQYGQKKVLADVSFQLASNQIVGLLGPNGSGKTTLLKILMGYIMDYSGSVMIDGEAPGASTKAFTSYLPEISSVNDWWKVSRALDFYQDMFADFDRRKSEDMLQFFRLDTSSSLKHMSKGMKEKLHIALIMSRRAKVFLLDEPLGGVDPASRSVILENIIKNYHSDSIMILSTHLITDIEPVLDRVLFLKDQKLLLNRLADDLRTDEGISVDAYFRKVYREV